MAFLYVTEYSSMGQIAGSQMAQEGAVQAAYQVAITGASVQSPVFQPKTRFVELNTDATCSIDIGTAPTADPTKRRMSVNQTIYRGIPEGGNYRVAVITNT